MSEKSSNFAVPKAGGVYRVRADEKKTANPIEGQRSVSVRGGQPIRIMPIEVIVRLSCQRLPSFGVVNLMPKGLLIAFTSAISTS